MKLQFWSVPCAMGLVAVFLGPMIENAYAGRGGGGGRSRESPAASGSLSSRSAQPSRQQTATGAQSSRQQAASSAQSSRQQAASSAQSSRQQAASSAQSSRQQAASSAQSSRQQAAAGYSDPYGWDAGTGLAVVATGAAVGAVVGSSTSATAQGQPSTTYATPAPVELCASPTVVPVGGVKYFNCGSAWYTEAYGPSGPTYVQVAAPPGF
jgi:multidrug efflux pump subunit AcrA (membrane-fusion protein)